MWTANFWLANFWTTNFWSGFTGGGGGGSGFPGLIVLTVQYPEVEFDLPDEGSVA